MPAREPLFGDAGALNSNPARVDPTMPSQIFDDADLAAVGFDCPDTLDDDDVYITSVVLAPSTSSTAMQPGLKCEEDTPDLADEVQPATKKRRSLLDTEDLSPPESVC